MFNKLIEELEDVGREEGDVSLYSFSHTVSEAVQKYESLA